MELSKVTPTAHPSTAAVNHSHRMINPLAMPS
jgi:hypothetical protein